MRTDTPGRTEISLVFGHQDGIATNQYAVWIEDSDGKLIKTLFVTHFTATGGWEKRPDAIPVWVEKSGLGDGTAKNLDAVTGATPKTGLQTYIWDCTDEDGKAVSEGDYQIFVEGTIFWKDAVTYMGTITVCDEENSAVFRAEFTTDDAMKSSMITGVEAEFKPAPVSKAVAHKEESVFQTSWNDSVKEAGMPEPEGAAWQKRLLEDIPGVENNYNIVDFAWEDYDGNGVKDFITQLQYDIENEKPEDAPDAYLCVYMNNDPIYTVIFDDGLHYYSFDQEIIHGDIDNDGCQEIVYSLFTGGCGGAGSSVKGVLKYKDHTLTKMELPGDSAAYYADINDVGYIVKVLFGSKENEYKAVCESLGKSVIFSARYATDEAGNRFMPGNEGDEAGASSRGYASFSIENRNGRDYLEATEYLHGEGGIAHCVGFATFLIDWDQNGVPSVLEFGVLPAD